MSSLSTLTTDAFHGSLVVATFLSTIVEADVLLFAFVVMPGIANLDTDKEFLRAFQVIGVIQANQPIFILVWMGSIVSMIFLADSGLLMTLELAISKPQRMTLVIAVTTFFIGQIIILLRNTFH
jgi:hypothetical protein